MLPVNQGHAYCTSTKQTSLAAAKDMAEDWYMELRNKDRFGEPRAGKTFRKIDAFVAGD